jgi:hypothetical protein
LSGRREAGVERVSGIIDASDITGRHRFAVAGICSGEGDVAIG